MKDSLSADPEPGLDPDVHSTVRLDCVGTDADHVFPAGALKNPRSYGAVQQETIDQVRAAQSGGLVQVWCVPELGIGSIHPGERVSLSPHSVPIQPPGVEAITAKVDACLLWSEGEFEQWEYLGPTINGVGAESGLEPPHTGAWVLLEADELSGTRDLAVWYPTLEKAQWALNESKYIDMVATDTSENWVEVSAMETISVRADTVTFGHFDYEVGDPDFGLAGTGYDLINLDNPQSWAEDIPEQDRELLHSLAERLTPVAQGLKVSGFEVRGPELFFIPPHYQEGYVQLAASNLDGLCGFEVTAKAVLTDTAGAGGQLEQKSIIDVSGPGPDSIKGLTDPAGGVLNWILNHDKQHPSPRIEPPIDPFELSGPRPPGPFFPVVG